MVETQIVPFYVPYLVFLTEVELEQAQPRIVDGLLCTSQGEPANYDDDDEYIFVITLDKRIIITKATATIHHVSLSHGRPLLASGAVKVCNGKVTYIDTESGHYLPSMTHLRQAIALFREVGLNIDFSCQVRYYDSEGVSHAATVEQFEMLPLEPLSESLPFYDEQDFNTFSRLKD